jgi:hypothetical protein
VSTAYLYNVPRSPTEWSEWTFANSDSHRLIVLALQQKYPMMRFDTYALDPLPQTDIPSFLLRHQLMHNQMDAPLGISGQDYTALNFDDPSSLEYLFRLHANEHIQAHSILRINA